MERELLRRAAASAMAYTMLGPPAVTLFVLASDDVPVAHRVVIWLMVSVTAVITTLLMHRLHRQLRRGPAYSTKLEAACTIALTLAVTPWAITPWIVADASVGTTLLALFLVVSALALAAVTTGPHRTWFYALATPMLLSSMIFTATGVADVPRLLSLLAVGFAIVLTIANRQIAQMMREAVNGRAVQEHMGHELEVVNERLRHRATHDTLTGLANRDLFNERLVAAIGRAARSDRVVAVVYLDIDRFKVINDSLGHTVGDELLQQVGRRLVSVLRPGDLCGRMGGDEFTILLSDLPDGDIAVATAHRVRSAFDEPFLLAGRRMVVTASVGVAYDDDGDADGSDLLRYADAALYDAKRDGRNRVAVFDGASRVQLTQQVDDEARLRDAIESGEIEAWYQPIVDVGSGRLVALEALARWRHPEHGILMPGTFLPTVTDAGLTPALAVSILTQCIEYRSRLRTIVPDDVRVYVNVDPGRMAIDEMVDRFLAVTARAEVPLSAIGMEITEHAVINDVAAARVALDGARRRGLAVALDDFGTGYSSLSLVRDLPLDSVKIDRSFVSNLLDAPTDEAVVASVVELARRLGARVTAEGVETREQRARLAELGVHALQGYLFSPARESRDLMARLADGLRWPHALPA